LCAPAGPNSTPSAITTPRSPRESCCLKKCADHAGFHSGSSWDLEQAVLVTRTSQLGQKLTGAEVLQITAFLKLLAGEQPQITYPILPPSVEATPRPLLRQKTGGDRADSSGFQAPDLSIPSCGRKQSFASAKGQTRRYDFRERRHWSIRGRQALFAKGQELTWWRIWPARPGRLSLSGGSSLSGSAATVRGTDARKPLPARRRRWPLASTSDCAD
jgi:hypothetical protein